ncbi:hypothetical protein BD769DRAFT_1389689 [Suillus cothurnatus]|nr:hypothetical protein BD769DRAFT_1389689 [Suillus cothurnatus]
MLNLEVLALQTLYLTLFLPGNTCLSSNLSTKPELSRQDGNLLLDNESESYEEVVDGMELQSMVNVSEEVEAEGRGLICQYGELSQSLNPNLVISKPFYLNLINFSILRKYFHN